jgi:MFS family permease
MSGGIVGLRLGGEGMQGKAPTETFFGWRIVAAVFVLATFGWGLGFYGPSVFLYAVHEARGWSLATISTGVTIHFLFGAVVVANLPKLYETFGVPRVTKAGCVALAAGIAAWAWAREPYQFYAATLLSGAGWGTMGAAAVNAIIAVWFVRERPKALSAAYNGASVGGIVFSPLWAEAIRLFGFPSAAILIGIATVATIWILANAYYAKTPAKMGLNADGDGHHASLAPATCNMLKPLAGKQLWTNWRFITLAAGMALGLFAQIGLLAHLFSLLVPALGVQAAGFAAAAATAAAIAGRTLVGWLIPPEADRRLFACGSYAVQILGSLVFLLAAGDNVPLLWLGVILFGVGIGNATSLPPLIAQVEFAKGDVLRVVALIVAISQGTYAFAPAAFGLIRELAPPWSTMSPGSAPWLFMAVALIQTLAVIVFLSGRRWVRK